MSVASPQAPASVETEAPAETCDASEAQAPPTYPPVVERWLNFMFFCARYAGWFMRGTRPVWVWLSRHFLQGPLRAGILKNSQRLLDDDVTDTERERFTDAVLGNFFMFIHDVGRAGGMTRAQLESQIGEIVGHEHFEQAHALGRGVIIATAHLGSFEVGIAAASGLGPRIHVVFQSDPLEAFNNMRHRLHENLEITEARVDDGWSVWMSLRDALERNELVLIQADRLMPGHRGVATPLFGGDVVLPLGPVKLAAMTGAPIVPVFAPRQPDGKVRIDIRPPIHVSPEEGGPVMTGPPPALTQLAGEIESCVRATPEQWLMLDPVWVGDQDPTPTSQPQEPASA